MATEVCDLGREARSLVQIESKPQLRLTFKRWEESFKVLQTSIESKRARVLAAKNEMYLLITFYFVFQGTLLNIVIPKANTLYCYQVSATFALSALASVAILRSVHDKFYDYHRMKFRLRQAKSEARALDQNISLMLRLGKSFNFAAPDASRPATTSSHSANIPSEERHYNNAMAFLCLFILIVVVLYIWTLVKRC